MKSSLNRFLVSLIIAGSVLGSTNHSKAQEVGVSFSYFLPKDGYFSTPISPFSFRGLGANLTPYFALETGFTLYRMSGLNIKDIPFESKEPLIGPNFTLLIPAEAVIQLVGQKQEFRIRGGGFAFLTFDNKLNEGNIDRALRTFHNWEVVNSDFEFDSKLGLGIHFGAEYIIYVTNQFGISLGGNYFIGDADLGLNGSYVGGDAVNGLQTVTADYPDSKIDFTGLEISLGVIFTN